jgi:hypothetical protein
VNETMSIVPDPELLAKYGCGPVRFSGDPAALYERHLLFDDIVAPAAAGTRERFDAVGAGRHVTALDSDGEHV